MPKIIRGTRDSRGVVVLSGGEKGLRKLRCSSCHGFAVMQTKTDGTSAYVCPCGAQYKVTPMN